MKRRYAIFVVVFAVSLLIGIQVVEVVDANPVPWPSTPNQEKPTLTIESPVNYARYGSEVPLDFNVTAPESWGKYYWNLNWPQYYVGEIDSVTVYLDSNLMVNYSKYRIVSFFDGIKTIQYVPGIDNTTNNHYSIKLNQTTS
jgi:hypothetical protein